MKAILCEAVWQGQKYQYLLINCPGCAAARGKETFEGLLHLPVNTDVRVAWEWDGNLERPTLNPSIRTSGMHASQEWVCHSFLRDGVFEFGGDSTHELAGQHVEMLDIPDWAERIYS